MTSPTLERVLSIVSGVAGAHRSPPGAGRETPLTDGGFWLDSVELLEIVLACEEAFGIVFDSTADLTDESLSTVGSLVELIQARRAS